MIRVGSTSNPLVFPATSASRSSRLLTISPESGFSLRHEAPGANLFRYSVDFGKSWSQWKDYENVKDLGWYPFSKTSKKHIMVDYWCLKCGSAAHRVTAEMTDQYQPKANPQSLPSLHLHGEFNLFGLDSGMSGQMKLGNDGYWRIPFMWRFPAKVLLDVWGERSMYFGDIDNDTILDRLPPNAQGKACLAK